VNVKTLHNYHVKNFTFLKASTNLYNVKQGSFLLNTKPVNGTSSIGEQDKSPPGQNLGQKTNDKNPLFVNGSGQNEQSLERTFYRYFLPGFTSFG
jgi:hypothetical protein